MRVIITGTTGMVGEGVLHECLLDSRVEAVLVINRTSCGVTHPRLREIIHKDFFNISTIEDQLAGYDACFFCLGVSSVGMKEADYFKITHTLTLNIARTLCRLNPGMTFCYVSGTGTDSTEKGRSMWARVKGRTENDLMKLPFRRVYAFRPGIIRPTKGLKNTLSFYRYFGWLLPVGRALFPGYFCSLKEIGLAMINSVNHGYGKQVLEVKDIAVLSNL